MHPRIPGARSLSGSEPPANLRATGRDFWPSGINVMEAVKSRNQDTRTRLLTTLGELAGDAHVIATGGLARRISQESSAIEQVVPFLTLEGLRILFEKNRVERGDAPRQEN